MVLSLRRSREEVHHVKKSGLIDRKFEFSLDETNLGMPKALKISLKTEMT